MVYAAFGVTDAAAEVLHSERSLYQTVLVLRAGNHLCMRFGNRQGRNQSCINPDHPERLVSRYAGMMLSVLLLNPEPKRMLVVGLGGGILPMALTRLFPTAHIDVAEIDPAVVRAAERWFNYRPGNQVRTWTQDARVFGKRQAQDPTGQRYDLILLDAFNADYIPEHLMTREYLQETRALLTSDGALAANTFSASELYDHESATYFDVFGDFLTLRQARSGNRIILASMQPLPSTETIRARARQLRPALTPLGVNPVRYRPRPDDRWDRNARLLTDQYAPANLLRRR